MHRHGFTLIELSIAIVIIGLIVGGVLVGRDLIEAAKLRSQINQLEKYSLAVNVFKLKYNDLPGDIARSKATSFGLPIGNYQAANGNGYLDRGDMTNTAGGRPITGIVNGEEHYVFWPQLAEAGLIEGRYSCRNQSLCIGIPGSVYTGIELLYPESLEVYFPAMKANKKVGILPLTTGRDGIPGNWWVLGYKQRGWIDYDPGNVSASLTPVAAYQLDSKMDDGVPSSGKVRAVRTRSGGPSGSNWNAWIENDNLPVTGCVTTAAGTAYDVANTNVTCKVAVKW